MASTTEEKKVKIIADGKQAEASINQITKAFALLNRERSKESVGSDRYKELSNDLQSLKTRLSVANNEIKALNTSTKGLGSSFKDVFAGVLGGSLVTSAISKFKELVNSSISFQAELSDSFSDIKKVTGLTDDQVKQLDNSLKSLDTRTSAQDLRLLAVEAGKLGIEGVEGISKFVKEADQIKVALGQDLGPEAITQIGRLSQIFKVSMLEIGSAINEIGAQSAATEAYQVDFLNRLAGTGPTAALAADELLGYSATLENMGQSAEVSGTALSKFFLEFIKDVEKFGAIAGMSKGKLTELLNSEGTNAAFLAFLDNLKQSKSGSVDLARSLDEMGIDGARSTGVFLALANSTEELKKQQDIANKAIKEGTSLTYEFNTKNENFAASLAKLKKYLTETFLNSNLAKGMSRLIGAFADLLTKSSDTRTEFEKMIATERNIQSEMNTSIDVLKTANLSQEARKELIKEINDKYGEYLPNLLTEKSSISEIAAAQKEANKAFEKKILLQQFEKELGDTTKKILELEKAKVSASLYAEKEKIKFLKEGAADGELRKNLQKNAEMLAKANDFQLQEAKKKVQEIKKVFSETSNLLFGEDVTSGNNTAPTKTKTGLGKVSPILNSDDKANKDKINNDIKIAEDMLREFERNVTILKIDNEYDRQRKIVELDFDAEVLKINNLKVSEDKKTELIIAAKKQRDEKLAELEQEKKRRDELEKAREDASAKKQEDKEDAKEDQAEKQKQEQLKDARKNAQEQLANELRQQAFAFLQQEQTEKYDRLLAELDKQKELELSNKSLTEAQKEAINKTYDDKRRSILNEQAKKEKQLALFRIGVETAVAAVSSLKTDPTGILAALIIAQGLAQGVVVGAKEVPQFYSGGNTLVRGSNDGIMYNASNVGSISGGGVFSKPSVGLVGEKGAELVIPNWLYTAPSMINTMAALESMIYKATPYANGGATSNTGTPNFDNSDVTAALKANAAIMARLSSILESGVNATLSWGNKTQDEYEKFTNRRNQVKEISRL